MKRNEGIADRIARVVMGIGILSLLFWGPQTALGYVGLVPIFTGLVGNCPLYSIVGFSSCPTSK